MPRELPALAFLHPDKHAVVYFFLDEYLFSVNVYDSAVVQFAGEPRGDVVEVIDGPLPINWRYVLAWVPRFKMVRNQLVLCLALLVSFFFHLRVLALLEFFMSCLKPDAILNF